MKDDRKELVLGEPVDLLVLPPQMTIFDAEHYTYPCKIAVNRVPFSCAIEIQYQFYESMNTGICKFSEWSKELQFIST